MEVCLQLLLSVRDLGHGRWRGFPLSLGVFEEVEIWAARILEAPVAPPVRDLFREV